MSSQQQAELFITVIEEHKGIIYKIARSFQKDGDDQKDLVQEITFELWRAFPSFDGRCKISTWLYRVALNVAIRSYRKEKKKKELILPLIESAINLPDEQEYDESDIAMLYKFIGELKELDRALMLLYLDKKSGKEMAEILGLSLSNIKTKTNRIKEQLKQRFSTIDQ